MPKKGPPPKKLFTNNNCIFYASNLNFMSSYGFIIFLSKHGGVC